MGSQKKNERFNKISESFRERPGFLERVKKAVGYEEEPKKKKKKRPKDKPKSKGPSLNKSDAEKLVGGLPWNSK